MNKVVLIGRLTKDPELKFTPGNGTAVTTFTIAVDRRFQKDKEKEADFIPIVVWGKQAESTANHMAKGRLIGISGRLQVRSYDAKDGSGKRYVSEVVADEVQFLDYGNKNQSEGTQASTNSMPEGVTADNYDDGEIPF
jgi:single-strand DNA-binding protein